MQYTTEQLAAILERHKKWLRDEDGGSHANLSDANLSDANLSGADLSHANLRRANLSYANLSDANLSDANLSDANLSHADLSHADLRYANLSDADLSDADLSDADLRYANLRYANLSHADLSHANLSDANLSDANLSDANLSHADLRDAANLNLQIEDGLIQKIAIAVNEDKKALEMGAWHSSTCNTTHCIAGWAVTLAKNGKELEDKYGTQIAGLMLLGVDAHSHFFDSNEDGKAYLNQFLLEESA